MWMLGAVLIAAFGWLNSRTMEKTTTAQPATHNEVSETGPGGNSGMLGGNGKYDSGKQVAGIPPTENMRTGPHPLRRPRPPRDEPRMRTDPHPIRPGIPS